MSKEVINLESEEQFKELTKEGDVLVDFFGTWCGPCKMLDPVLVDFANDGDVSVVKVDVDKFETLSSEYEVMSVPALKAFRDGELVSQKAGYLPKTELENMFK